MIAPELRRALEESRALVDSDVEQLRAALEDGRGQGIGAVLINLDQYEMVIDRVSSQFQALVDAAEALADDELGITESYTRATEAVLRGIQGIGP